MVGTQIAILVVLIFLSALFSGIETALMSINMIKVNSLLKQKKKEQKLFIDLNKNRTNLLLRF